MSGPVGTDRDGQADECGEVLEVSVCCSLPHGHVGGHAVECDENETLRWERVRPVTSLPAHDDLPDECENPRCVQIAKTASEVYCEITDGRLSYPTYDSRTVLGEANVYVDRLIAEAVAERVASLRASIEAQVREQVASEIEAERDDDDEWEYLLGLLKAAAIARGGGYDPALDGPSS